MERKDGYAFREWFVFLLLLSVSLTWLFPTVTPFKKKPVRLVEFRRAAIQHAICSPATLPRNDLVLRSVLVPECKRSQVVEYGFVVSPWNCSPTSTK
ncbi:hypothetical protein AVEN_244055-1 [Araneus ventricosus]|uniref:Uncharacterized protein n=1 Tax=Araneus ventricosus TaxID=182803 RepID=A0A4Y2IIY9_ARAVE|nr:hypothetical protein AVEN_244055-1 [Araneus ventricosus]